MSPKFKADPGSAPPYDMPDGFTDIVGGGEAAINWRPRAIEDLVAEAEADIPLTHAELIERVTVRSGLPETEVARILDQTMETLAEQLIAGHPVMLERLGVIKIAKVETVVIPAQEARAMEVLEFIPDEDLVQAVEEGEAAG